MLYKLDGGIDHVLIDEAQDTSPEQWDIVKQLTGGILRRLGRERGQLRTIFAVGDEKQSIFSFQGADPSQFDINRRHFAEVIASAEQQLRRSAADHLAPLRAGDSVFCGHGVRRRGGTRRPHLSRRRDRSIAPIAQEAKGGIEFWPALKPEDDEETDYYAPVDVVQKRKPGGAAGGAGGRQDRWLAEKRRAIAGPRPADRARATS